MPCFFYSRATLHSSVFLFYTNHSILFWSTLISNSTVSSSSHLAGEVLREAQAPGKMWLAQIEDLRTQAPEWLERVLASRSRGH